MVICSSQTVKGCSRQNNIVDLYVLSWAQTTWTGIHLTNATYWHLPCQNFVNRTNWQQFDPQDVGWALTMHVPYGGYFQ